MRTVAQLPRETLDALAAFYGMSVAFVAEGSEIPGSHWGAPEAGLKAGHLYLQASTPVHSFLHELAHVACMDSGRARTLDTDAGGTDQEEEAVCYLQASLAGLLPDYSRHQLFLDMDAWGYSFRQGSAAAWFREDGPAARQWLIEHRVAIPDQQSLR